MSPKDDLIKSIGTLHRYFIWANRMRTHFDEIVRRSAVGGEVEGIERWLYMSYWYGGLYVVIEGWRELNLHDPEIDALLDSPRVDLLRRYRNGVFHFQRNYFDTRFIDFMKEGPGTVRWVRDLNQAFGRWFLQHLAPEHVKPELQVGRTDDVDVPKNE